MKVIYSIASRLAGGGIGNTAYHAVSGIYRHGALSKAIVSSSRPTQIDRKFLISMGVVGRILKKIGSFNPEVDAVTNTIFDLWASSHVESCDIFHGWAAFSLHSLRKAKTRGAVTVIERASTHPITQARLIDEEYEKWGLKVRVPKVHIEKMLKELAETDYVTIPSEFVLKSFLEQGYDKRRLILIPFGVDINRFAPAPEKRRDPNKLFRALFVGQISIRKGVPYLIEAWKRLSLDKAELILAGGMFNEMQSILRRIDVPPNVRFVGYQDDPAELFRSADVFVFPSIEEGSALVTYEAMASGLPVITTPNAGSIIHDGQDGFLVPPGDVEALAGRINDLYNKNHVGQEIGLAARRKVEGFTWERYGDDLVSAYNRILSQGPRDGEPLVGQDGKTS